LAEGGWVLGENVVGGSWEEDSGGRGRKGVAEYE